MEKTCDSIRLEISKNLERALSSLETMNSYITTRDDYKTLMEQGVLDPTCFIDLKGEVKSMGEFMDDQTEELEALQQENKELLCQLLLLFNDREIEAIVRKCQNKKIKITANELIKKAQDRKFTNAEYVMLVPMICMTRRKKWKDG